MRVINVALTDGKGRRGAAEASFKNWFLRRPMGLAVAVVVLAGPIGSPAVTILSGPSFTPATNAPLAGVLQLTTDTPSRISVLVNDGTNVWARDFYDYATSHSEPLFGFKAARTNHITVTVHDQRRNQATAALPLTFVTGLMPTNFPNLTLLQSRPSLMEPGYTLFLVQVHSGVLWWGVIVDHSGEVVWYSVVPSTFDLRRLANGDLFMPWTTNFNEVNLLGDTVRTWNVPANLPVNQHEGLPTPHGSILYFSDATEMVTNYPTSMTVSNAPLENAIIVYQKVVEISATNAALLNTWSPINLLDPRRISYMMVGLPGGWDAQHSNAIIEDPRDNSIIVSIRHQNALVKFSRATGQLVWILGPPDNWGPAWQPYLLKPVGTPFIWQWAQHAPIITPQGTLMLYDNGNYRASPFAPSVPNSTNYSRAVEYSINEQTMEVSQVWDYGRTNVAERLFTDHEGYAEPEPITGNVLINFANVEYDNGVPPSPYGSSASMVRLTEVTHEPVPQIVFDLAISMFEVPGAIARDCSVYRCHRIPDLYAHPAVPVADLSVTCAGGWATVEFSADDFRTYVTQSSTNLVDWQTLGAAFEWPVGSGQFSLQVQNSGNLTSSYYRVITQ